MSEVPVEEQAQVAAEFATGLVDTLGLDADVRAEADDEYVRLEICLLYTSPSPRD